MTFLDVTNSAFEAIGAFAAWTDVRRIRRDKVVAGVYWPFRVVWSVWGFWNLYYYAELGHVWSMLFGAVLAVGNSVWAVHAWRYSRTLRFTSRMS